MSPRRWLFTVFYLSCWPVLIMALAGDRRWIPGWILSGWIVGVGASTVGWLAWRDPALLAERYRMPGTGGQSRRDRRLVYALAVGFLLWVVLMPLDGGRFHWTPPLPRAVAVAGGVCLMLGWVLVFRAMADNTFGSALVRVQRERGHRVITTGVYGWVRHPMYLGAACMFVGGPLLAGAASALVVGLALTAALAVRSLDEEALLTEELTGYEKYRRRVRYRLIPYVW
jgi:protein-S-isoprenylcysteine O-methyltransferase Ste14